jgi:hypothetical protein
MTVFESVAAQPASRIEPGSYAQALYGLHHDRGVAENIFAARAKAHFADILGTIPKHLEMLGTSIFPLWVDQQTLGIRLKDLPSSPKEEAFATAALPLESMVTRLAHSVLDTYKSDYAGKRLVLLGSLYARVQDIGGGCFSFSLKQRWGFSDE